VPPVGAEEALGEHNQLLADEADIGLTAVLLLLANWGDVTLPAGLCLGLPAVGYAPPYGIFP
jgi:hypothetical protein